MNEEISHRCLIYLRSLSLWVVIFLYVIVINQVIPLRNCRNCFRCIISGVSCQTDRAVIGIPGQHFYILIG